MVETSVDRLLDGRLAIRQPLKGHRAGTDAILVAASATTEPGDMILDAGSGVGTIGLLLALREPTASVLLLERETELATLARDNIGLNGVGNRVAVNQGDLFDRAAIAWRATLLVSNPPFYAPGTVRASPHRMKARAHAFGASEKSRTHGDWLRAMLHHAQPHARVVLIHRPEALPALLESAAGRLGNIRIRPILPRQDQDAIRIIFGGIISSRAAAAIAAPIVLHETTGCFTAQADDLNRGTALLPLWPKRQGRP